MDFSVARRLPMRQRHPHRRHRAAGLGAGAHHRAGQGRRRRARGARAGRDQTRSAPRSRAPWPKRLNRTRDASANRRGAARLAAVQALYQMDHRGDAAERHPGASSRATGSAARSRATQYLPAEAAFFRDVVRGVVDEQRRLDPMIDQALQKGWPLKRIETRAARGPARRRLRARPQAPTCRRAWWCPNMSMSPMPSSIATRPAWSMRCSTSLRGSCARASSTRRRGDAVAERASATAASPARTG